MGSKQHGLEILSLGKAVQLILARLNFWGGFDSSGGFDRVGC